MVNILEYIIE